MSMNVTQTAPRAPMAPMPEGCEHGGGGSGPAAPGIPTGRVPVISPAMLEQLEGLGVDVSGLVPGGSKQPGLGADLLGGGPVEGMLGKQMPTFDFGASRAKVGQAMDGVRGPSSPPGKTVD